MRGKKIDTEFVAEYISTCAQQGKTSPEDIVTQAELEVQIIDNKIKEVESLKKIRSKLIDVIFSLNNKNEDKSSEITILDFYKVKNFVLALSLCSLVEKSSKNIDVFKNAFPTKEDTLFVVKELLEISVLKRSGKNIEKGQLFNDFVSYAKKRYTKI